MWIFGIRNFRAIIALIAAFMLAAAPADAQLTTTHAGLGTLVVASYTGPGDVVSYSDFWGLRGVTAAYSTGSNPAADVCDSATFTTCSTINILSNGTFDAATASGSAACAATCVVKKLYDQVTTNHMTCSSAANCPTLTFNCVGSLPCLSFNGSNDMSVGYTIGVTTVSISGIGERTNTAFGGLIGWQTGAIDSGWTSGANTGRCGYNGADFTYTMSDNTVHALQCILNGASSVANVDNTTTNGTAGTTAFGASNLHFGSFNGFKLTGELMEGGIILGTAWNGTQQTNLCHNMRLYWSTPGSC